MLILNFGYDHDDDSIVSLLISDKHDGDNDDNEDKGEREKIGK